jgi:hypothetical protein
MFDLRRFWLGTAVYVFITGAVVAAAGGAFYALVGMPSKESRPDVTQLSRPAAPRVQTKSAEIEPEVASPAPRPRLAPTAPGTMDVTMPQLFDPAPLIVPEPRSNRRRGPTSF